MEVGKSGDNSKAIAQNKKHSSAGLMASALAAAWCAIRGERHGDA